MCEIKIIPDHIYKNRLIHVMTKISKLFENNDAKIIQKIIGIMI